MNKQLATIFVLLLVHVTAASGDDTDIYLRDAAGVVGTDVRVELDYGPELLAPLCLYGESCREVNGEGDCAEAVCFTTSAYQRLKAEAGGSVSQYDALVAAATSAVSDSRFAGIHLVLRVLGAADKAIADALDIQSPSGDAIACQESFTLTLGVEDLRDPVQLEEELNRAFREMLAASETLLSTAVPLNMFNHTALLDRVYVSLFQADYSQNWMGNLKKYKWREQVGDSRPGEVVDASEPALLAFEASGDDRGRIAFDALSYWTEAASLPAIDGSLAPVAVDGRVVTRGGAGQKVSGFVEDSRRRIGDTNAGQLGVSTRQVFVEPVVHVNGIATAFDDFDADGDTLRLPDFKTLLGDATMSDARALELIRWGRGQDTGRPSASARDWILAESLHSRALAVNYGSAELTGYGPDNPNIHLFFGTGDGLFHILEDTTATGVESGRERFAFYPRELLGNLAARTDATQSSLTLRYGVDGAPVALVVDNNSDGNLVATGQAPLGGDEVYVYFGLRRGGSSYYALDVSNPRETPTLKWKISPTVGGDFDELGLSFSVPVVGKVNYHGVPRDVLIFTAGYHGGWDATRTVRVGKDGGAGPDFPVGTAIYIVDARTGALIWKAVKGSGTATASKFQHPELIDSMPSSVAALRNANNVIHRLYVGDSGGVVWRVDLPELDLDERAQKWFVSKVAELGNDGQTVESDRRFFHAPDIVHSFDSVGDFDGLVISSGDRAHPNETQVTNYHFYIKDRKIISGDTSVLLRRPLNVADTPGATDLPDQTDCQQAAEPACVSSLTHGWKIKLARAGEKGLSTALVDGGRVFMSTFVPAVPEQSCNPGLGQGYVYVVNLEDGSATDSDRIYSVGPGIPSAATVLGDKVLLPGWGINPMGPASVSSCRGKFCNSLSERLYRLYWREPGVDVL
ncbi:MAG: hypothetical protein V7754_08785 [Halioglobus sp.]